MNTDMIKFQAPELSTIEESKAEKIRATFLPMAEMLQRFEFEYADVITDAEHEITKKVCAKAKRVRLDIAKVRIETEKLRKSEKEEYLRAGKAIDGVSNILKWAVTEKEEKLKEIEDHFDLLEKRRLEQLQSARVELLMPYVHDATERDLSGMAEDVWTAYLTTKQREYADRIAAEQSAEESRIKREQEEAAERARIKAENDRLKAEAVEREKAEQERIAKAEAERKAKEAEDRKRQEAHEAELRKQREEAARVQREETAKRLKLEAELKAKAEAERKAKEAEEARIQQELSRGDAEKLAALVAELKSVPGKYEFNAKRNRQKAEYVAACIEKICNEIQ